MNLSDAEIRVLGCLLEKQRTVPDQYPLSLNSLRLACNQSTNREPVVDYDETIIREALHHLERRGYTRLASGRSRTAKYRHLLSEALPMSDAEQATMCVLMLRGAQTPGELKQRTERMHRFEGLDGVHETLERLIERGLLARLDRRPGQKEERYTQLLGEDHDDHAPMGGAHQAGGAYHAGGAHQAGGAHTAGGAPTAPSTAPAPAIDAGAGDELLARVEKLERDVAELRAALFGADEEPDHGQIEADDEPSPAETQAP